MTSWILFLLRPILILALLWTETCWAESFPICCRTWCGWLLILSFLLLSASLSKANITFLTHSSPTRWCWSMIRSTMNLGWLLFLWLGKRWRSSNFSRTRRTSSLDLYYYYTEGIISKALIVSMIKVLLVPPLSFWDDCVLAIFLGWKGFLSLFFCFYWWIYFGSYLFLSWFFLFWVGWNAVWRYALPEQWTCWTLYRKFCRCVTWWFSLIRWLQRLLRNEVWLLDRFQLLLLPVGWGVG